MNPAATTFAIFLLIGISIGWTIGSILTYTHMKPYTNPQTIEEWRKWLNKIESLKSAKRATSLLKSFKHFADFELQEVFSSYEQDYIYLATIKTTNSGNFSCCGNNKMAAIRACARMLYHHYTYQIFQNELR